MRGGIGVAAGQEGQTTMRRKLIALTLATGSFIGVASALAPAAHAAQPGPGDKQCIPGQDRKSVV